MLGKKNKENLIIFTQLCQFNMQITLFDLSISRFPQCKTTVEKVFLELNDTYMKSVFFERQEGKKRRKIIFYETSSILRAKPDQESLYPPTNTTKHYKSKSYNDIEVNIPGKIIVN